MAKFPINFRSPATNGVAVVITSYSIHYTKLYDRRELVYMNDGSVVKGQVMPVDDDRMVVRTSRDLLVLFKSDIDTITSGKSYNFV